MLPAAGAVGVHRKIPAELGLRPLRSRCSWLVLVPLKGMMKLCLVVPKKGGERLKKKAGDARVKNDY